jgi:glycosyltransferase involved in cell wall biosynthesis
MPSINQLGSLKNGSLITGRKSIGYIGGVSAVRGSLVTLEALKILKRHGIEPRFECVGRFFDDLHRKELLRLRERNELHNVFFHGYMPAHEGWPIIAQCDIGLAILHPIANYVKSYPTKVFEYMAMGLPVIASNFPLYKEVIERSNCGLCVNPLDPQEIAEAIRWLIEHPFEARRMGENGRKAAGKRYNWELEEQKLLDFYETLLTNKKK